MDPKVVARALAVGRIAIGAALVLAPRSAALWIGADGRRPGATVLARALGIRDLLIGGMVLHTIDHPEVAPRWLASAGAMDAVDALAGAAVLGDLPRGKGPAGVVMAGGSALTALALARAVRAQATPPA